MDINTLIVESHKRSKAAGWWHDPITGLSLIPGELSVPDHAHALQPQHEVIKAWFPYVIAAKIALIHSETSEALEAYRVDAMDDKLPQYPGIAVEMADVLIRVGDLIGMLQAYAKHEGRSAVDYDIDAIIEHKFSFNATRPDHALATRALPNGKKF